MNSYPASEQRISEVERGRICNAILPMPSAKTLSAGDSIIFALAYSHAGQETCYVSLGIRSVSCSPRSLISEQLIPPLAKPFFDSPGTRSVKASHPALSPSVP